MAASPSQPDAQDRNRSEHLDQLEQEARTHRNRLRLYRARVHSGRLSNTERLKELERISELADSRLARAKGDAEVS